MAGTTRDGAVGVIVWQGKRFRLVDTGGLCDFSDNQLLYYGYVEEKVLSVVRSAQVVLFVVDVKDGLTRVDEEIALLLKKVQKPVVICANKCDVVGDFNVGVYEFCSLGFGVPLAVSALHGHSTGDLLDEVCSRLDFSKVGRDLCSENVAGMNVAIVGKPNAGKSSLVNKIASKDTCIVTEFPGTTRDSIDVIVKNEFGSYNFVDTAGIRKQKKVDDEIEHYSVLRSKKAIENSDICLLIIDAIVGCTEQDTKILEFVESAGKGCVVVVNKWDLVTKDTNTMKVYEEDLRQRMSFARYIPVVFVSAKTGQKVDNLFPLLNMVYGSCNLRVTTGNLNSFLCRATSRFPTPSRKGKKLKIYYVTQVSVAPPTFVFFVNSSELFHFSYQRYIENRLRENFELQGTFVRFIVREKAGCRGTARL